MAGLALASVTPVLPATAAANPSGQISHETSSDTVATGVDVVTLVTGDRVRVTHFSGGRTSAALLPGSPHLGTPVRIVQNLHGTYVMPQLPATEQQHLDVSLFNVSALARLPAGAIPVSVTFAKGVDPHAVPGLTLDTGHARATATSSTTVAATYAPTTRGISTMTTDAWRGVTSVALPAGVQAQDTAGRTMHTLTIHVLNTHGKPVSSEVAWVQNVDDARTFTGQVLIKNGVGTVSVPEGNYAVLGGSYTRVVVDPDFTVADDTSITMRLSDATVRPTEDVPGYGVADAGVSLQRDAAKGGGLVQILVSDRFAFYVQPVAARLPHGSLKTVISGTLAPAPELRADGSGVYSTLAYTKDYRSGVPNDLSFTHDRSDFAIVPQKFYANGPAGTKTADALAFAPFEVATFGSLLPVRVPSLRTIWLQGSSRLAWEQDYNPTRSFGPRPATLIKYSGYTPGNASPVRFAHGPVGPGMEAGYDADRLGTYCLLCRNGNQLHGSMPLFSGAGTAMSGLLEAPAMGSWTLTSGHDMLDSGNYVLAPNVTLPAARSAYTLRAVSHPGVKSWRQSTDVSDVWTFTSAAGRTVVPLLMPSYVPRVALDGSLAAGATRFALDFGNLGPVDAAVQHARVELSVDGGASWTDATVTRLDWNSFAVTYTNPKATTSSHYMSLRVTGVDAAGRTVTETALNVYRLVP